MCTTGLERPVNFEINAPVPAKPTDITAPAVAPNVVSTVVLLASNVASSPNCHEVEKTNGVRRVAAAPTFTSAMLSAFLAATVANSTCLAYLI